MPGDAAQALELLRHDSDIKVPFAFLCTGVPLVQMTLVLDPESLGLQRVSQAFFDFLGTFFRVHSGLVTAEPAPAESACIQRAKLTFSPARSKDVAATVFPALRLL